MAPAQRALKLSSLLAVCTIILAACGAQAPTSGDAATSVPAATIAPAVTKVPAATAGERKLEIYSFFVSPSVQSESLKALVDVYKRQNPGIEVVNLAETVAGGSDPYAALRDRLQREQPPDSLQVHAGKETLTYVTPGQLEPLTQFFREQGFDKVMPRLLLDQITIKGEIYTVPLNIHRSNVLWYNPKIFKDNQLQPPKTMDDFFTVAKALKARGITPLAVAGADQVGVAHLFESVLLATFGPDDYARLFQGDSALWTDARILAAVTTLKQMLGYANQDRSSLGGIEVAQLVLDGKAGMTITGDWADGDFKSKGAKPNMDFGWAAAPGTDGVFLWLSDSFGLARGASHRDAALAWLKVCGSREGQDAFNPKKGSIPTRTDADKSLYDAYLQWSIDQFAQDKLAPSVVHGAAAPNSYKIAFLNALAGFSNDLDAQALTEALNNAVGELAQ